MGEQPLDLGDYCRNLLADDAVTDVTLKRLTQSVLADVEAAVIDGALVGRRDRPYHLVELQGRLEHPSKLLSVTSATSAPTVLDGGAS